MAAARVITGGRAALPGALGRGESERPCCLPGRSRCGGQVGPLRCFSFCSGWSVLSRSFPGREFQLAVLAGVTRETSAPRGRGPAAPGPRASACAVGVLGPWRAPACLARRASSPNRPNLKNVCLFKFSLNMSMKRALGPAAYIYPSWASPQKGAVPSLAAARCWFTRQIARATPGTAAPGRHPL